METIKHFFGLCGEPHLNIYTVILLLICIKAFTGVLKHLKNEVIHKHI